MDDVYNEDHFSIDSGSSTSTPPLQGTVTVSKQRASEAPGEGPTPGAYRIQARRVRPPSSSQFTTRTDQPVIRSVAVPEFTRRTEDAVPVQEVDALCTRTSENNDPNIDADSKCVNRRVIYWLAGVASLIACVGAVVGIVVSLQESDSPETPATDFPSASPTVSEGFMVELIQSRSPATSFVNSSSAQSRALDWMLSDPYTLPLEDARLVQRFALATFWYSTHGATWSTDDTNHSRVGWLEPVHECDWDELGDGRTDLTCNSNKEVIQMNFRYADNLSGHLPAEIGLLSQLAVLGVVRAALSGTIPTEVALLTGLSWLNLHSNKLSGSIPTELGLLTKLSALYLDDNTLIGSIPTELGLLSELLMLGTSANTLTGTVPTEVGLLSKLSTLHLEDNTLTGTIPTELGLLTKLWALYLGNNTLIGSIPTEVGLLTHLFLLEVSHNVLSGSIPSEIGLLEALAILNINDNALSGSIPTEMGVMTSFSFHASSPQHGSLDLHNNDLSGTIPPSLCLLRGFWPLIDCGEIICTCCRDWRNNSACMLP